MNQTNTRDSVLEALKALPEDATLDQIIERLVFMAKLEEGLQQSEARALISHEDIVNSAKPC
jgi:hypothetical protein